MKHKTHHHKTFITLLLLLVIAIGFLFGRGMDVSGEFQLIFLLVNTIFLVIITHFLLEIYSGNRVLEVVDVTPRGHLEEAFVKKEEKPKPQRTTRKTNTSPKKSKSTTKKSSKSTKKKTSRKK
ncbi:MAG: hypothetical protein ACOCQX_02765 [Candidatus Nanoarchaeia archaeon]